jgi:two-component system, NarL family, sensor kinase
VERKLRGERNDLIHSSKPNLMESPSGLSSIYMRKLLIDAALSSRKSTASESHDAKEFAPDVQSDARRNRARVSIPAILKAAIDCLPMEITIVDEAGDICAKNRAWDKRMRALRPGFGKEGASRVSDIFPNLSAASNDIRILRNINLVLGGRSYCKLSVEAEAGGQEEWTITRLGIGKLVFAMIVVAPPALAGASGATASDYALLIEEAKEAERNRIARDLHDMPGQLLAAASMNLSSLNRRVAENPLVQEAKECIDEALSQLRAMAYLLHPPILDKFGLPEGIRFFIGGFERRTHIAVECDIDIDDIRLSRKMQAAFFLVLQEALLNVHKHAHCAQVSVRLAAEEGMLVLQVTDTGAGVNGSSSPDASVQIRPGVGVAGMTARMQQIGGTLEINHCEKGLRVTAKAPLRTT